MLTIIVNDLTLFFLQILIKFGVDFFCQAYNIFIYLKFSSYYKLTFVSALTNKFLSKNLIYQVYM